MRPPPAPSPAASPYRPSAWETFARRLDPFLDPTIAVVCVALALTSFLTTDIVEIDPRLRDPDVLGGVATVAAAGALAWRRSYPRTSYGVFLLGSVVVSGSSHYIGLLSLLLLLSVYSLTTCTPRRDAVIGVGAGIVCFVGLTLADVPDLRTKDLLLAVALLVTAWAVGEMVRTRREAQQDQIRTAITEERLRIARELHDVVAHSMSLIAVQAGVGAHLMSTNPAAATQALHVIADTSRKALEQTRSMLGMLREETGDGNRPPTPGLDDLPTLVEDVRAAGLAVDLVRTGPDPCLGAVVSLAAYRIVQESLTNVIKHSAATSAAVRVAVRDEEIDLEITDHGPSRGTTRANAVGHGLIGLDERARLVGGALSYGVTLDGFRVHARLPRGSRP